MKRFFYFTLSILLFMLGISLGGNIESFLYADETPTYTSVIEDLSKDKSFNKSSYPQIDNENSLQVIQIAESSGNELFVYVYNPSADRIATSINISTTINAALKYNNYVLKLVDSKETLQKYVVVGLTVLSDETRYYDISSIYRAYDKSIDKDPGNDNTVSEIPYEVGKLYIAFTVDGVTYYSCKQQETIEITDKHVGYLHLSDGWYLYKLGACDSHFVAFSTDKQIDSLIDADVYYTTQTYTQVWGESRNYHGSEKSNNVSIRYDQTSSNAADGLFARKYTWPRIQSVSDFIKDNKLSDATKAALKDKKWVLRFADTKFSTRTVPVGGGMLVGIFLANQDTGQEVRDVSILRLKFETDGVVYNLGVVDNKQTGSLKPSNVSEKPDWKKWLIIAIVIVLLILFFPLYWPILRFILSKILKSIWVAIKFVFTLPIKVIE